MQWYCRRNGGVTLGIFPFFLCAGPTLWDDSLTRPNRASAGEDRRADAQDGSPFLDGDFVVRTHAHA
jgi:hypothetical protein